MPAVLRVTQPFATKHLTHPKHFPQETTSGWDATFGGAICAECGCIQFEGARFSALLLSGRVEVDAARTESSVVCSVSPEILPNELTLLASGVVVIDRFRSRVLDFFGGVPWA